MSPALFRAARDDPLRDFAAIERVAAVTCNRAKRTREIRIAKEIAGGRRSAARQVECGRAAIDLERRHAAEPLESGDFGDRKSVLGMRDCRGEDGVERRAPEFLVERHPAGDGSGHGHGMNAGLRHRGHSARGQELDRRTRG